jgi:multiple antibiotic resistance protein
MGPIKVLLVYMSLTRQMEAGTRRKVASRVVLVAGSVGVGLFAVGAFIQSVLHFSIGALNIIGGLILLLLALKMIMGNAGGEGETKRDISEESALSIATSPLAIPLTLNPVGIVSLVVASSEVKDIPSSIAIVLMIGVVMSIDYAVLLASDKVAPYMSTAVVQLLEVVLGIFLGALAIQLALNGLAELGIITISTGAH